MTGILRISSFVLLLLAAVGAAAQAQTTYHGCVDAAGNAVAAVLDSQIANVVETHEIGKAASIHYNPAVLPRLQPTTRLFLFASQCSRQRTGLPANREASVNEARRADCAGLATLMRSGLLGAGEVAGVEADLALSADEWRRVPGPERSFDLQNCPAELALPPLAGAPTVGQREWNTCVRGCGEPLRTCGRGPARSSCQERYERCSSVCDFRFPR